MFLAKTLQLDTTLAVVLKQQLTTVLSAKRLVRIIIGAWLVPSTAMHITRFLTTYVEGLGLEDLEGCERFFAKLNALASGTWYASTFHRRQAISEYALFTDKFETYANLSKLSVHAADHILIFICLYCRY